MTRLSLALWRLRYTLEELRQCHAARGRYWREAACCIVLALLRLGAR